jgi:PAS domain-containing protein
MHEVDAHLRMVLGALSDVILLCSYDPIDNDSRCVWCNRAALLATGMTLDEVVGAPPRTLLPIQAEFDDPAMRRLVYQRLQSSGVFEFTRTPGDDYSAAAGRLLRVRLFLVEPGQNYFVVQAELLGATT